LQAVDLAVVTEAVKKSRQRISQAKAELETSLGRGKFVGGGVQDSLLHGVLKSEWLSNRKA
jgi:hypothetical protein